MEKGCPQCKSEAVVEGKIYNQVDYINPPAHFRPNKIPFYAMFNANILMRNIFFACSSCGFIWSKLDSQALQRYAAHKKAF
ncbi:hypothetical protein ACFL2Y_02485 [Candidatus Omnitrophota bacterium]